MSVVIFKGEGDSLESTLVQPKKLVAHLNAGWRLDKYPENVVVVAKIEDETEMLRSMKILPSIDNVIIGATHVNVYQE